MIKPLLIEIATEELPAIPFLNELPNIEKKWILDTPLSEEDVLKTKMPSLYEKAFYIL